MVLLASNSTETKATYWMRQLIVRIRVGLIGNARPKVINNNVNHNRLNRVHTV
jgi:hypothetical protein